MYKRHGQFLHGTYKCIKRLNFHQSWQLCNLANILAVDGAVTGGAIDGVFGDGSSLNLTLINVEPAGPATCR